MGFLLSRVIYFMIFGLMAFSVFYSFLNSKKNSKIIIKKSLLLRDDRLKKEKDINL